MGKGATDSGAADLFAQAMRLAGAGDLGAALAAVERVLALAARDAAALALKGALLTELGRPAEALDAFDASLAIAPANAGALSNRGNALARLERPAEAVQSFDRALALRPDYALALCNRAGQHLALKHYDAALDDADRALAIDPRLAAAHRNRSRILLAMQRPRDALASLDAAQALGALDAEGHAHRGAVLTALGRPDAALESYDRAVALSASDPENLYRRAHARLRLGDFDGGWRDHEARWRARAFLQSSAALAAPALRARFDPDVEAADLAGKAVLIVAEQGVGDQIMFASILPDLAALAGSVACLCDGRLAALFSRSLPQVRFVRPGEPLDLNAFDHVAPMASLGRLFRTSAARFPGVPYLRPRDTVVAAWKRRLGPKTTPLRIGISWRGGADLTGAAARSMTLATLAPLLARDDCEFVSLQYGDVADEIAAANTTLARPIRLFTPTELDDFEQLAGLAQSLDAVVSVQNTNVHLCGALGKPCLAMIPFAAEWRYGAAGFAMPWYGSVRLIRQAAPGDWSDVVTQALVQLDALGVIEAALAEATTLARGGDVAAAIAALEALGPGGVDHGRVSGLMGTLLTMSGQAEAALAFFGTSLALNPLQPTAHTDLGNALSKLGRPKSAVESFDRALALEPDYLPALNNRSGQRLEIKDAAGALDDADRVIARNPKLTPPYRHRSRALLMLGRLDEALTAIDAAMALEDDNADNFSIRAAALTALGRFEDAAQALDAAVALQPANPNYRQSRAYARLRLKQFRDGWADHEHRWQADAFRLHSRGPAPLDLIDRLDTGAALADLVGKRVLLVGEQGVGDQIMFASMIPDLMRDAASVACLTSSRMQSLFETSFPGVVSLESLVGVHIDEGDKVVPMGSLGALYRNTLDDFPGAPYLHARDTVVAAWRERLGDRTAPLRVGISWRGGGDITGGAARSLSLDALRPLLERQDCEFVSLQYGGVAQEVEAFNATLPRPIRVFPREDIENFEALAGLVQALDLIVSVQTSLIHLSGAVGAPCLVMIPFIPEWRYGAAGASMPWYGSVELFRQSDRGDWRPVIAAIGAALDRRREAVEPPVDIAERREAARGMARAGRMDDAIAHLQATQRELMADAGAAALLGGLLARRDRLQDALVYLQRASALAPSIASHHADLGRLLARLGRGADAIDALSAALAIAPDDDMARLLRAAEAVALGRAQDALADLDILLAASPAPPLRARIQQYRSRALGRLERFDESLDSIDAALVIEPDDPRNLYLRGRALIRLMRADEAQEALERTVALDPSGDAPRYLLSLFQLHHGDWARGWENYERRWKVSWFLEQSSAMVPRSLAARLDLDNRAEDFDGKAVLLIVEQGVGDQIMFASVLPDLLARAASVTCVCEPRLTGLLQASFPTVTFIPPLPTLRLSDFDKVTPLASLPHAFRRAPGDWPGQPYLTPSPAVAEAWRVRLGPKVARLRVGVSWRGGTDQTAAASRSLSLEALRPLFERADCEFVNLQYGDVADELAAFNATLERPITVFPKAEIDDFEQLAGLVSALDLVVSVQTTIIHLCGALGAPCLVMIPFVAEWRYGTDGETMPWYGSVRLVRQTSPGDWAAVVAKIGAQLDARAVEQD